MGRAMKSGEDDRMRDVSTPNADQTLLCVDCGNEFTWSISEQQFFKDKGFAVPRRCRYCRKARRASQLQIERGAR